MGRGKELRINLCAAVLFGALALDAEAASFDCRKAMSPVEKLICSNRQLSDMDEYMGDLYAQLRKVDPSRVALAKQQIAWLKSRDRECPPERPVKRPAFACVAKRLEARIDHFNAQLQALGEGDIEGPDENDTGISVVASTPTPKAKPKITNAQASRVASTAEKFDPVKDDPIGSESQPLAEGRSEDVAKPSTEAKSSVEAKPPADLVDNKVMDAYRVYYLLKACEQSRVPGATTDPVKPLMKKMDDAAKAIGKDTDKLWEVGIATGSEDGEVNTLILTAGMTIPLYAVGSHRDKAGIQQMCDMMVNLVNLHAQDALAAMSPDSAKEKSDGFAKDF